MSIFNDAYRMGTLAALIKIGTVAGPIAHPLRESRNEFDFSQDRAEDLWREMDQEPAATGEEHGIGMPSAGGINKNGSGDMLAYFNEHPEKLKEKQERDRKKKAADDYGSSSKDDFGSFDHNASKPQKEQILSSAIEEAFKANEDYDQSYGMGEPAMTQPHGSKYAANPLAGGSAPVGLGTLSPNMGIGMGALKPPTIPKVKAPGANAMANVHSSSNALLSSNSIMSGGTRAIGSPLQSGAQAAGGNLT